MAKQVISIIVERSKTLLPPWHKEGEEKAAKHHLQAQPLVNPSLYLQAI